MIHINIGSNQDDSSGLIARAVALIVSATGCEAATRHRLSPPVGSKPWGFDSDHDFMNVGLSLYPESTPDAEQLLATLQAIERSISPQSHRNADGSYRDRAIDIDLIAIDSMRISSPTLTLPHPRMERRAFVLMPLDFTDSSWRHPVSGLTAAEMLAAYESERSTASEASDESDTWWME